MRAPRTGLVRNIYDVNLTRPPNAMADIPDVEPLAQKRPLDAALGQIFASVKIEGRRRTPTWAHHPRGAAAGRGPPRMAVARAVGRRRRDMRGLTS